MDKIWYRNPSKSEVIGRCGGDEKPNDHLFIDQDAEGGGGDTLNQLSSRSKTEELDYRSTPFGGSYITKTSTCRLYVLNSFKIFLRRKPQIQYQLPQVIIDFQYFNLPRVENSSCFPWIVYCHIGGSRLTGTQTQSKTGTSSAHVATQT